MELDKALDQIAEIRRQMARAAMFRGWRWATASFSGVCAILAALAQELWIDNPTANPSAYLYLWSSVALGCAIIVGIQMAWRYRHTDSPQQRQAALAVAAQFLPALVAGALLTLAVAKFARPQAWMLPGLWAMFFSMGIFACRKLLPPAASWIARYYLLAGLLCLILAQGEYALWPWAMGITFGVGQFLSAAVLYFTLERHHG